MLTKVCPVHRAVKVREQFSFAHPTEVVKATDKYCNDFYGSNFYDLRGNSAEMLYGSWRTNLKLIWGLPRSCKTYFLDYVATEVTPPNVALLARFHNFFHSLINSPSNEVSVMARLSARDVRTKLGKNLVYLRKEALLNPWMFGSQRIKDELLQFNKQHVPDNESWRIQYFMRLLEERIIGYYNGFDTMETNNILWSLVST